MAGKTVVLAFFKDEPAADDAVDSLKSWDKARRRLKLDAIGVLALDDKGKVKTYKLGKRSVGKGAGIGLVLAVIAPPTLLAGVIGGGLLGASITRASASRPRTASGSRPSSPMVRPRWASSWTRPWRSTSPPSSPSSVGPPRSTR